MLSVSNSLRYIANVRITSQFRLLSQNVVVKSPLQLPELQLDFVKTPLPVFLFKNALKPDRINQPAIVDGHTQNSLTFGEVTYSSYSLADSLKEFGIQKDDCVAIMSPNHLYYLSCFLSISLIGAISSCINPLYSETEIKYQLEATRSKYIFTNPCCLDRVLNAIKDLKDISPPKIIVMDLEVSATLEQSLFDKHGLILLSSLVSKTKKPIKHEHDKELIRNFDSEFVMTMPFSSGTTGKSKGVLLTHHNLVANVLQTAQLEKRTNIMVPLPFFHIYGLVVGLLTCFHMGSKLVFMSAFDLQLFLQNIQTHSIERAFIVPPIVLALAKHPLVDKFNLSSLKVVISGAAPLGGDVQEAASKRLNCLLKQGWGMTELSPLATITPDEMITSIEDIKGSSGYLVAGTEGKVVHSEKGHDLPQGEEGEVMIRGPQVMKGYLDNPEATRITLRSDGWLHTGDIGVFDSQGRLFIHDRMKELIKYKGFQVPPAELEALIATMKEVKDVVVIPVPDEEGGEVPRAYVVKQENCRHDFSEEDIIEHVHQHVAPHKRLRGGVRFTDIIPKTASGKLLRRVQIQIDRQAHQQK